MEQILSQVAYALIKSLQQKCSKPAILARRSFRKYKEPYLSRNLICIIALVFILFFPTSLILDVANAQSFDLHEARPDTLFVLDKIEVTQAIQDEENSVPLIQGKTAIARVFLHHATDVGFNPYINRVRGELTVRDLSTGIVFYSLPSMNTISAPGVSHIDRSRTDSSLNFWLPGGVIVGSGPLQILSFSPVIDGKIYPCISSTRSAMTGGCADYPIQTYTLEKSEPVRIELLNIPYKRDLSDLSPVRNVRNVDFNSLYSWLWRAYPSPYPIEDKYSRGSLSTTFNSPPNCHEVGSRLAMKAILDSKNSGTGFFTKTRYYGLVSDAEYSGGWMRGCAAMPTTRLVFSPGDAFPGNWIKDNWVWVASGPAGSNTVGWDNDGSYADWYGGHEIGHLYGRGHPPFADTSDGTCTRNDGAIFGTDYGYPYPDGLISGSDQKYVGFDNLFQRTYPGNVWTDMMTYRCNEWISDYTYRGILKTLNEEGDTPIPRTTSVPAFGNPELGLGANETLVIVGNIDLTSKNATMEPFLKLPGPAPYDPQSDREGSLRIDLYDGQGQSLASYPIEAWPYTDTLPGEHEIALISALVPFVSGTTRITISENGQQIFSRDVLPTSPLITMLSPANGEVFERGAGNNTITVRWGATSDSSSSGLGTNPLTFFVLYSPDAGKSWHTVASHITENEVKLNLDDLPGSEQARFRVIATDGVNTDTAESNGIFTIPFKEPQAAIFTPSSNMIYSTDQPVLLAGEAFSRQDGSLYNATSLQWSSNIQGQLGSGPVIVVSSLAPGEHVISLTARDSTGLVGISSVDLTVTTTEPEGFILAHPNLVDRNQQALARELAADR